MLYFIFKKFFICLKVNKIDNNVLYKIIGYYIKFINKNIWLKVEKIE